MKASDIKVGEEYAAQRRRGRYAPVWRAKVLEVGVPRGERYKRHVGYVKINDGVRIRWLGVSRASGKEEVVPTKGILRPWAEQARINAERADAKVRQDERDAAMIAQVNKAVVALAEEGIDASGTWNHSHQGGAVYELRLLPREAASLATVLGMLAKLKKRR